MNYVSTRNAAERVSFKEAALLGLAQNRGLYVPEQIPSLLRSFFENIEDMEDQEIAFQVMHPFVQTCLSAEALRTILKNTLVFPIPVVSIEKELYALELFHGPTQAFKDVGAKFMSGCISYFTEKGENITVLVATSGDTGGAVAHGFYKVKGVTVKILFPKDKISAFQEHQITSLGHNIHPIEVAGTFDDCQALVKQAFDDVALREQLNLSSANSINIARFLPQMIYYFLAYKQLKKALHSKKWLVSVPSGNFGNLTAGLLAKKMGLPVHRFIAANNANDVFYRYWKTGLYRPRTSVVTCSNAMDVGAPSNFERILYLYQNKHKAVREDVLADHFSDEDTLEEIKRVYEQTGYVLDPHGAVGSLALKSCIEPHSIGMFLETAHPQKFENIIRQAIPEYPAQEMNLEKGIKYPIQNHYSNLVEALNLPKVG